MIEILKSWLRTFWLFLYKSSSKNQGKWGRVSFSFCWREKHCKILILVKKARSFSVTCITVTCFTTINTKEFFCKKWRRKKKRKKCISLYIICRSRCFNGCILSLREKGRSSLHLHWSPLSQLRWGRKPRITVEFASKRLIFTLEHRAPGMGNYRRMLFVLPGNLIFSLTSAVIQHTMPRGCRCCRKKKKASNLSNSPLSKCLFKQVMCKRNA